jgi:flavorubredoxin
MLRLPLKYGVLLSSYGWGAGAGRLVNEVLGKNGVELVGALEINWQPGKEDQEKVVELGNKLSEKILNGHFS